MAARLAHVSGSVVDLAALPKVTIDTEGAAPIESKETYVNATIAITGEGAVAARSTQIRGRGNTTWEQPKKPYKVKLTTAASLVPGVAADRDWVLLASYLDPSRIRSATAFEVGNRVAGLPWVPQFRDVELVLNGDYVGVYQVGEHVKIDSDRINIASAGTTGLALTGGYTLAFDANDPTIFTTAHDGLDVSMDEPDGAVTAQADYTHTHLDAFETALYGASWLHPTLGYARYIDMDSFAAWYLVAELTANQDSGFFKSCKFYKTRDPDGATLGKLFMGPIWDFDLSIGNNYDGSARDPEGIYIRPDATWYVRLFDDPTFAALIATRWAALKDSLEAADSIYDFVDATAARLGYAMNRERIRWGNGNLDYATAATTINAWLTTRIAYLDTQFT